MGRRSRGGGDADGPGTLGALALQPWRSDEEAASEVFGPYDSDELDPDLTEVERVDFGAIRVPVPPGGRVCVDQSDGRLQAVHVTLPGGRLSVSALAAPRGQRLWPDLAAEIDESLRDGGASVRSYQGEWGRELHARTGGASSVFVGADGPRWMVYGVATGPSRDAEELDAALRRMLKGTVVTRGRAPYPPRTVLPLTVPPHLAGPERADAAGEEPASEEFALRTGGRSAGPSPAAEPLEPAAADRADAGAVPAAVRAESWSAEPAAPATAAPVTAAPVTAEPAAPARPAAADAGRAARRSGAEGSAAERSAAGRSVRGSSADGSSLARPAAGSSATEVNGSPSYGSSLAGSSSTGSSAGGSSGARPSAVEPWTDAAAVTRTTDAGRRSVDRSAAPRDPLATEPAFAPATPPAVPADDAPTEPFGLPVVPAAEPEPPAPAPPRTVPPGADAPTVPFPVVPPVRARPAARATTPPAAVPPPAPRSRHARPDDDTGPLPVVTEAAQPALAFLAGDPLDLFDRPERPGRHRRPE